MMELSFIIALMGGLALFLYGMKMMSDGLELCAGDRLQSILERLTSNRLMGVIVGALITALIQSSSATTVMTVGFVNAGLMTLPQAVGVIMGANIGTTITGQLIALDIGAAAPAIALVGVVMVVFLKKEKTNAIGMIVGGLGILFIGMGMMSDAMAPLRNDPTFLSLITAFNNPIIAVLTGAVFTAVIQSSSASIGILQTLANNGLITLQHSVFILFGMNHWNVHHGGALVVKLQPEREAGCLSSSVIQYRRGVIVLRCGAGAAADRMDSPVYAG